MANPSTVPDRLIDRRNVLQAGAALAAAGSALLRGSACRSADATQRSFPDDDHRFPSPCL
jgi:hypothetical protein